MQEILLNLFLGIVSGLVGSGMTLFIRSNWEKIIIPWFEERIYKGVHIEGRWQGEVKYSDTDISLFVFDLKRNSHRVFGDMISKESGKTYKVDGEFRNMILTLTYTATLPTASDRGCFTFLLVRNGKELDGHGAFYYSPEHRITTAIVKLVRVY